MYTQVSAAASVIQHRPFPSASTSQQPEHHMEEHDLHTHPVSDGRSTSVPFEDISSTVAGDIKPSSTVNMQSVSETKTVIKDQSNTNIEDVLSFETIKPIPPVASLKPDAEVKQTTSKKVSAKKTPKSVSSMDLEKRKKILESFRPEVLCF